MGGSASSAASPERPRKARRGRALLFLGLTTLTIGLISARRLLQQPPAPPVRDAVIDAAWNRDYQRALLRSATERSLLFAHFSTTSVPLAKAMDQVLASEPVRRELQQGFVLAYLDSRRHARLFERLLGTRGALGSAVVDPQGETLARLVGFADARHVLAFVSEVRQRAPELERLQRQRSQAPANAELELELELGDHFAALGQHDRAREHYRTAQRIALARPGDHGVALARARQRLTLAALAAGDVSGARRELELGRQSAHARQLRSELAFAEAKLLATERRVTDAIDLLEESLDLQESLATSRAALRAVAPRARSAVRRDFRTGRCFGAVAAGVSGG